MQTDRDRFLKAVRTAVAAGNQAGGAPPLPDRAGVGYQGAGADPVGRFAAELAAAGGTCRVVADRAAAVEAVLDVVRAKGARRAFVGTGPVLDPLEIARHLREAGVS